VVNLEQYCDQLTSIGYAGWLSLELFREDLWVQEPLSVAKLGLEKMRLVAERI
jgi:sugar phosphate isomerase/epimerase